jgi:hypothetical protein
MKTFEKTKIPIRAYMPRGALAKALPRTMKRTAYIKAASLRDCKLRETRFKLCSTSDVSAPVLDRKIYYTKERK